VADHTEVKLALVVGAAACLAGVLLYPALVSALARRRAGQTVAVFAPAMHRVKAGTPTFGGVLFCAIVVVAWLVADRSRAGFVAVFALAGGALLGALDDITNVRVLGKLGLAGREKLAAQCAIGILVGVGLALAGFSKQFFPGLGAPDLRAGVIIVAALAVVATSNAVNLTDGVDGLAASCSVLVFIGITVIAGLAHDRSVVVISAALVGGLAAFLVFNWFPARIFMGDTGSLALGCVLVVLTAELHLLWWLPLLGLVFVIETLSVIVNVTAIRRYGRRVLRASPLHHHFEELGIREHRLVALFAAVAAAATLITVLYAHFGAGTAA
jgi:phospho-N-acetylmuramoyl-pentapeptide-transferase